MTNKATDRSPIEVLLILAAAFPACFSIKRRRPLKVGIKDDIAPRLAEAISESELKGALRYYTSGSNYLRRVSAGAARIDLSGNAAGCVTEDEANSARARLRGVRRKKARKAERLTQSIKKGDGLASLKSAWRARQAQAQAEAVS